jgi:hypothetical protein
MPDQPSRRRPGCEEEQARNLEPSHRPSRQNNCLKGVQQNTGQEHATEDERQNVHVEDSTSSQMQKMNVGKYYDSSSSFFGALSLISEAADATANTVHSIRRISPSSKQNQISST